MLVNIKEKRYGKTLSLKDIHIDFPKGKTSLIIGTSGAGKSTLIKCLIHETSFLGKITEKGLSEKELLKKIAYIPQHPALNKNETVEESIYWTSRFSFLFAKKDELLYKTDECIDQVGLTHVKESKIKNLSGGQMQRVAIAKELIRDKEIIIADEIDTGLDCGVARSLSEMLQKIAHEQGKTVIIISHNLTNVTLYDQIVVLVRDSKKVGRVAYCGSPFYAKQFFNVSDYVDILTLVNRTDEGGLGKADMYIDKFSSEKQQ